MRMFTNSLNRELNRAVYMTERRPRNVLLRAWRRVVEWWIFGGKL